MDTDFDDIMGMINIEELIYKKNFAKDYLKKNKNIKSALDKDFDLLNLCARLNILQSEFQNGLNVFESRMSGLTYLMLSDKLDENKYFKDYEVIIQYLEKTLNDFIAAYQKEKKRRRIK